MKTEYLKPAMDVVTFDTTTVMMADSADTGMDENPDIPDARGRRGTWGNLWRGEE